MRIITAITPDHIEVLRHTLPINMRHGPVTVFDAPEAYRENEAERIRGRLPCKPDILDSAWQHGKPMVWLDADAWIVRPLPDVWSECDIAVTMRRPDERGGTDWPDIYGWLNAGVVFVAGSTAAWSFLTHWRDEVAQTPSRSDQHALNNLVRRATDLTEYDQVFPLHLGRTTVRIKVLRTDEYNWSYWPEEPTSRTRILHMKNNQRKTLSLAEWTAKDYGCQPA